MILCFNCTETHKHHSTWQKLQLTGMTGIYDALCSTFLSVGSHSLVKLHTPSFHDAFSYSSLNFLISEGFKWWTNLLLAEVLTTQLQCFDSVRGKGWSPHWSWLVLNPVLLEHGVGATVMPCETHITCLINSLILRNIMSLLTDNKLILTYSKIGSSLSYEVYSLWQRAMLL